MRISKITLLYLVSIIVLSLFVAKISNLITVNYDYLNKEDAVISRSFDLINQSIDDGTEQLMWFVQISDIHISIFHDPGRISDFRDFCNKTLDVIRPTVVLASGDLADAKAIDSMGSKQFIQEWQFYNEILQQNKVEEKTMWLDIRGNHDNFDVPSISEQKSHYHHFSVQGKRHLRSYMYTITKDKENYSFIGVDACLDPGPRRPFNFIGLLTPEEYQMLEQFELESRGSTTVWFGHYPTSCIISPAPGIRHLMRSGVAYMCGHLHTLAGTVPNMYTLHHSGMLELELGDWKDNRLFRIAAFDHGLFTFTDVAHGKWPAILVTNPKHALFNLPKKEPLQLVAKSTHIRILVFSPTKLETVRVKLDNEDWIECQNKEGPLFVAKWEPQKYSSGLHELKVYARSFEWSEIQQPFSLDDSKVSFRLLPRIALMLDAAATFQHLFILLVIISILPLAVVRIFHILVIGERINLERGCTGKRRGLLRKLWILSTVNKLFFPLIMYPIYITVGPWFVGEVIEGYYGAVFAWGTMVQGKILPGSFTYFYGFFQLFCFHIPFVLLMSHCVDCRFKSVCWEGSPCGYTGVLWQHVPCTILLGCQAVFAYSFWLAYGTIALIIGPLRTWSFVMALFLWYVTVTLKPSDFEQARLVWTRRYPSRQPNSHHLYSTTNNDNCNNETNQCHEPQNL